MMQKTATQIFIVASLLFGVLGIMLVFLETNDNSASTSFAMAVQKCFMITVFIILPSFALSVAGKYLSDRK